MQSLDLRQDSQAQQRVFAMAETGFFKRVARVISLLTVVLLVGTAFSTGAHASDVVTTYKDDNGWRLLVNGEDYYIKGVVWSYTPRGENYNYNLWREDEALVKKVIDYDFSLLKAAGVNSIRTFMMIPPKWITYIYETYGIRTVINPLMGRYGYTIAGRWTPFTDYSDELTRATLKADTLAIIDTYKDVPGVLMFALGNESNYGLSWSSFEIENLPVGEQETAKARYLYSLFNEVIQAGKKIAPNHPFSIVNGDIQYIDLIAELVPELDILGSNVYRGKSFTYLWRDVDQKLDLPVLFFEFGSDAFNARERREDQLAQATYLKAQWQEMYHKAWGNGEEGNSIGGYVFQSRDEWWKYLQEENLDVHDTTASWSNQAFQFDWMPDANNMNEEWFGIMALGTAEP
jgi:beta-galactosidase